MKDFIKRFFVTALAVSFLTICIPQKVEARDYYKYYPIEVKQNLSSFTTAPAISGKKSGSDNKYDVYVLKLVVPKDGYVTISTDRKDRTIYVNKAIKTNVAPKDNSYFTQLSGSKTYYRVFPQGTYYLWNDKYALNVKYKFVSVKNPTNYTRATATKVAANTNKKIVFNYGNEYSRWYKINLTKNQKVTINMKYRDFNGKDGTDKSKFFTVYNSKGDTFKCTEVTKNSGQYRTATLKKGNYYVRVDYSFNPWNTGSRFIDFSWK